MKICGLTLKVFLVLSVCLLTACPQSRVQPPQIKQQNIRAQKSSDGLEIKTSPVSGTNELLFVRLEVSDAGSDFISQNLMQNLTLSPTSNFKYHNTLLKVRADITQPLERRGFALALVHNSLIEFLQKQPHLRPFLGFEIETTHVFPPNFFALLPNPKTAASIIKLQQSLFQNAEETLMSRHLGDVLTISPNTLSQNYIPHMTIYKPRFGTPPLAEATLNTLNDTVSRRVIALKNQNRLPAIPFQSIVFSY